MSAEHVEARPGAYADSVTLMQVSTAARNVADVEAALVAMATDLNLGLLPGMGFEPPPGAGANDLLIAIRARDDSALAAALAAVEAALTARPETGSGVVALPRTTGAAIRAAGPGLALVSVPGRFAFAEAMDALQAGCDVMIFSDNVPVEQEIRLKDVAADRGLLVLGPDCGTAVVGGVGLGFANAVLPGPVGLVAASGSGAQQLMCLLDAAGVGISAVLGVGGRDLSGAVAGRSTRAALAALDDDPATELVLLVSKPSDPGVAADVRAFADRLATPVLPAIVGPGEPDLTAAAERALARLGADVPRWPRWPGRPPARTGPGVLHGLFAGGTLCDEAMVIAAERLGPIRSNIPLRAEWRTDPRAVGPGHAMVDFGDDAFTTGRAHPMIDQALRLERLAADLADPQVAALLLDVVLGHGAHPDPAAELAPVIAAGANTPVVVSLVAAAADPQDRDRQAAVLQAAGAHVFASNAEATRFACTLVDGTR